jgi:ATP-binding cassette subfamily C protein LapB
LLAGRCVQPLQRAIAVWTRFQTIRLARDRVEEVFSLGSEEASNLPPLPAVTGEIEFQGVSFRYQEDGPNILDKVSLKIAPGETVGICGGNSSGKTTFLSLMAGMLRPIEGTTLVDGNDLKQFDPSSFSGKIAYLPQNAVLFNGTILENLTMFRPDREQQARHVAQMSDLHDMIIRIPQGYDSKVGDGAYDWLPRGFKQRIAIARALVDEPQIYLFDEANAALDGAGDLILNKFLAGLKGKRTLVLVSHRPSILKLCDRIYDLRDGHLVLREKKSPKAPKKNPLVTVEAHD